MRIRILVLALLATGCNTLKVDPSLQEYITRFEKASPGMTIVDLEAGFGDLSKDKYAGVCYSGGLGDTPTVVIDTQFWAKADDTLREQVVFHELGHCILQRIHVAGSRADNIDAPVSLMHSGVFSEAVYVKYRADYIKELFHE